jgi:glycosyltransferase involved in cell wall biosynthesis
VRACGPYLVALVVIARDEAPRIGRLLASVRDHVDSMLVLDTGSTDETAAIAAAYGARVRHFRWIDDFSAARNAALQEAAADWHLVLDADEWLVEGADELRKLRSQGPSFVGTVLFDDRFDDGQMRVGHGRISRVLPGHLRYSGRVHEQPVHTLPVHALGVKVGHDGYMPGSLARKRGRNRHLLVQAISESPHDSYLWYQLGKDAAVYDEHGQAEIAFARAAARRQPSAPWWSDMVTRRLFSLKRLGRHADGMRWAAQETPSCADSPDVHFALGDLLLDWAADDPRLADRLLPMIERAWTSCLEIGERPGQVGSVSGRGSSLAAHNLALVYEGTGRIAEAARLRCRYVA